MKNISLSLTKHGAILLGTMLAASLVFSACQSASNKPGAPVTKTAERVGPVPGVQAKAIRINAGATAPYTDPDGQVWLPDQGFADGSTVDRGEIEITGTKNPVVYRTEHHSMTKFSVAVPNGSYTVNLHFAETFSRITEKGQRVFSLKVNDKEIKDLDVLARAGAPRKAWVDKVPVTVSDGKIDIIFTPGVQRPEINGIEIIPQ